MLGTIYELQTERNFSAPELEAAISARAEELKARRARPGQGAFLLRANSAAFFVDLLACWRIGLIAIPLDPQLPRLALESLLRTYDPAFVLEHELLARTSLREWPLSAALLLLSSGSTGKPKGILHSHRALELKMQTLARAVSNTERTLCALPTYFGHGLICNSLFPLLAGQQLFLSGSFSPKLVSELDKLICHHQITFLSSTPVLWELIENFARTENKPSLRRIHCASAPLRNHHAQRMRDWAPHAKHYNVYGLTELLGWVSCSPVEQIGVGTPWDAEFKIENERLWLRAPYQLIGLVQGEGLRNIAEEEWIPTGDLATEKSGQILLRGRGDFLINKGGIKVDPMQVEEAALQYPAITNAICLALTDELWGEKVGLAVCTGAGFEVDRFRTFLAERLPASHVPDRIQVLEAIPTTSRGKVDRAKLREIYDQQH